jgi:hypothetical protein
MADKPVLLTLFAGAPIPDGTVLDGSVAALSWNGDGTITAEICIPGPPVP